MARWLRSRRLRYGGNALLLAVAVLGILVLLNVVAQEHRWRRDLTSAGRFTLSEQTRKALASLDREVQIIAFFSPGGPGEGEVRDLLEEYEHGSPYIRVRFVDPDKDPALAQAYQVTRYGTTVLEMGPKRRTVQLYELYDFEGSTPRFQGEQAFTSALLSLMAATEKTVYFMEGHRQRDLVAEMAFLRAKLTGDGYQVKTFNVGRSGKVPEDCDLLVVAGPRAPLQESERQLLTEYLRAGGRVILMLDPLRDPKDVAGWDQFLVEWGVRPHHAVVVDPERNYFMDVMSPVPIIEYHPSTESIIRGGQAMVLPGCRPFELLEPPQDLHLVPLLRSSPAAWGETSFDETPSYDHGTDVGPGPLVLGVLVGPEEGPAQLAVFGSSAFLIDQIIRFQGNCDFFLNLVAWMLGEDVKVSIRPRNPEFRMVFLTAQQARMVFYGLTAGLPGLVFLVGAVIWWRRRRL